MSDNRLDEKLYGGQQIGSNSIWFHLTYTDSAMLYNHYHRSIDSYFLSYPCMRWNSSPGSLYRVNFKRLCSLENLPSLFIFPGNTMFIAITTTYMLHRRRAVTESFEYENEHRWWFSFLISMLPLFVIVNNPL